MNTDLLNYINQRKKELNAVILAHFYQSAEIQDLADFVGDSLELSKQAATTDADTLVFCGVKFMAESAKILSPAKTVLLPDLNAGCPMADMITAEDLKAKKEEYPDAVVVCYVNSSAEVKAESDICCTSSNAIKVVESIPDHKPIIFVPDKNLGAYIQEKTNRDMILLWEGYCPIHDVLTGYEVEEQKKLHQNAEIIVHPECTPEVTRMANKVSSTGGMLQYVQNSPSQEFIIGTEENFLHTLTKNCPDKKYYLARNNFTCKDMQYITPEKLAWSLEKCENRIELPEDIRKRAYTALNKMINL